MTVLKGPAVVVMVVVIVLGNTCELPIIPLPGLAHLVFTPCKVRALVLASLFVGWDQVSHFLTVKYAIFVFPIESYRRLTVAGNAEDWTVLTPYFVLVFVAVAEVIRRQEHASDCDGFPQFAGK